MFWRQPTCFRGFRYRSPERARRHSGAAGRRFSGSGTAASRPVARTGALRGKLCLGKKKAAPSSLRRHRRVPSLVRRSGLGEQARKGPGSTAGTRAEAAAETSLAATPRRLLGRRRIGGAGNRLVALQLPIAGTDTSTQSGPAAPMMFARLPASFTSVEDCSTRKSRPEHGPQCC